LKRAINLHTQRLGMQFWPLEKSLNILVKWPLPATTPATEIQPLLERWESPPVLRRPTVFVVSTDSIASQLYRALHQRGHAVGRDISILSLIHERTIAIGLTPPLTSLDIRAEAIGRRAVEQLLWRLRNQSDAVATKIFVEPRLVEGGSVAQVETAV
jgi:LacI family transcriptional regulator